MQKILFHIILFPILLSAQQRKWDAVWMLGQGATIGDTVFVNTRLDFNHDPVKVSGTTMGSFYFFDGNVSMCNAEGDLMFYSNMCDVANDLNSLPMEGGGRLWNNKLDSMYCWGGGGIGLQGMLALPIPKSDNRYMIYYPYNASVPIGAVRPVKLYSGLVDMAANGGLGKVTEKYKVELADTLGGCFLTAVQHANGHDWWIVVPRYQSNGYYNLLLDSTGTHFKFLQNVGEPWRGASDGSGQAVFSPDGKTYARINPSFGLHLYDFDRCTGKMSNPRHIKVDDHFGPQGVAISPNARYLYATSSKHLWQFDLLAADVEASRVLIDTYDPTVPNNPVFYMSYLAPDNKIYIAGTGSHRYLHIINAPNNAGLACDFAQHGLWLPTYNYVSLPNNPYYRLGQLDVPCDPPTNSVEQIHYPKRVNILPNPTEDYFTLQVSEAIQSTLQLLSVTGSVVLEQEVTGQTTKVDVSAIPPGIYFCRISDGGTARIIKKVIIHR